VGSDHDITELLLAWRAGDRDALDRLFPLVYEELRQIAHRRLGREREGHTLGTTALVNEAYLKLVDQTRAQWADRAQFFAVAARAMRRILVDYARRHHALKRGGAPVQVNLDDEALGDAALVADQRADTLLALDDALTRLAELDERLARVVECRFFGGFTEEETAEVLGVTPRTVRRDWVKAKGWLYQTLRE
jgi:RNA polymerase sigma factor (TIGR02999 family)